MAKLDYDLPVFATQQPMRARSWVLAFSIRIAAAAVAFLLVAGLGEGFWRPAEAAGNTITAASCSQSAVQAAVNAAVDGDTVLIPDGSCSWSTGISTTKQIRIQAKNYTPTPGGTMTRSVTITNNSSSPLFHMQSGNSYHVGIGGIRFNEVVGGPLGNAVRFTGSGSKVPLLFDCSFETKNRFGSSTDVTVISWLSQGGVGWNLYMDGTGFGTPSDNGMDTASPPIVFKHPRAWTTASTMGTLDTNGTINVYIEDSTLKNVGSGDLDDNARVVLRHSTLDGTTWVTHGFTSLTGGRHFELYNNTLTVTTDPRNIGRYFWIRAGTGIFTDNNVQNTVNPQNYGNMSLFQIGDNTSPGSYPMPRQPGWGHNGTTHVSDPIYAWNNIGARASAWGYQNQPGGWQNIVVQGRDVFVNAGAKPGYQKYIYPHPLRSSSTPTPADTAAPSAPGNLSASAASTSQIDLIWAASTDNVGVTGYLVERCSGLTCTTFSQIATSSTTLYSDSGLAAGTTYRYRVRATDAAGNLSGYSSIAGATTPSQTADTTAPSVPGSLSAAAASTSQINLTWAASTDNVGVTGYRLERCSGSTCTNFSQIATPTMTSFSNTGLAANTIYRYRVRATDAAGNLSGYSSIAGATTHQATGGSTALPEGQNGIAAAYPGDANIGSHSDVLFADDFETYSSASQLTSRWSSYYHSANTRIATETGNVFTGNRSLEFTLPQTSSEVANAVVKAISPTQDRVFVRVYTKFDSGYDVTGPGHNGIAISSKYPGPGQAPNGSDFFLFMLENSPYYNEAEPGYTNVYTYHPEQRSQWGDHWYPNGRILPYDATPGNFGPNFVARPDFIPDRNKWYSYEMMVQANTPGARDGRVAVWIDGKLVADFQNVRVRDISDLKIDQIQLQLHAQGSPRVNKKWYDNVVVARSYIGPMATGNPPTADTTAPSIPTSLSASVASITQINLTWAASTDNVGVTGYRLERCSGSTCTNFSQIATPSGTSFSDTGLSVNTTYRYRVRATDAAGNLSGYSSIADATTQDTTAPSAPGNLSASAASASQINLTWSASTDNVGVTGYRVERCSGSTCTNFSQIATPTTTSFPDPGLAANTTYRYRVRATDAAGNLSGYSSIAGATTQNEQSRAIEENIWGSRSTSSFSADGQPWELGMVFIPTADGQVKGVRVFGATGESGAHTARLWRNSDNKLLSGPHTISYSGSGWKEFLLPTPVPLVANQAYTISVSTGQDSSRLYTEIRNDPALGTGGNNGKSLKYPANAAVYSSTIGVRPTQSWQQSNYLRDVIFVANQTTSVAGLGLASEEFQATAAAKPTATAEVNSDWRFVEALSGLVNPVVIAGPPSFNDGEPGVARVRYLNDEGFEFRFQEWDYLDGPHSMESIPYLVLEPGRHVMSDGSIWEVGTFALGGTNSWKSVQFSKSFGRAPYLFLTVQTENDQKAVTVRARSVGTSGFQAALFEEEAQNTVHGTETVGYLAIYSNGGSGSVDLNGEQLPYALQRLSIDHNWTSVLGQQLKLEEEQSKDPEVRHVKEIIHVLTLGQQLFAQQVSNNSSDTTGLRRRPPN